MPAAAKLSHTAAMVLQSIHEGFVYGFSIMERTGLPSGTVYPALRRLDQEGLISSQWEPQAVAEAAQRPPRKCYKITRDGRAALEISQQRYPLLTRLAPSSEPKSRVAI